MVPCHGRYFPQKLLFYDSFVRHLFGGDRPSIDVKFIAVLSTARFVVGLLAGQSQLSVFQGRVQLTVLGIIGAFSQASGNDDAADSHFFRDTRLFFKCQATLCFRTRVFHRLRRTLVNSKEGSKDELQDSMNVIFGAGRINHAAFIGMFFLFYIRVRLTKVARIIDLLVNTRANYVISASFMSANSIEHDAIMLTSGSVEVNERTALRVETSQYSGCGGRVFVYQVSARLNANSSGRQTGMGEDSALMEEGGTFIRFCRLRSDFLRAFHQRFDRRSTLANKLRAHDVLLRARGARFTIFAARDFRALRNFLAVVRTDNDRIRIRRLTATCFRFTPYTIARVSSRVMIYLRVAR